MIWMSIGVLILGLVCWKDRDVLRIDFKALINFLHIIIFFTLFRFVFFSFMNEFGISIHDMNQGFTSIELWRLPAVILEDAFFAIPIYYIKDKWKCSKYLWMPIVGALSLYFAVGHIYQSTLAFFATILIPYLFFYELGKKYGFGTTMICQVVFDIFSVITFKLAIFVV